MASYIAHVTVNGADYWLQPDGTWTDNKAGTKPLTGAALTAAQQAYAAQGGTGTAAGGPAPGGGVTPAAGGPGAVSIPAPQAIMAPGISYSGRFGSYSDPGYQVGVSYAGPENPSAPVAGSPAPAPQIPAPTPTPVATGTGSPAGAPGASPPPPQPPVGSPAPGGAPGATGGQGGGPARGGGIGGAFGGRGGNQGFGGGLLSSGGGNGGRGLLSSGGTRGGSGLIDVGQTGGGLIDLGQVGAGALSLAGLLPGWAGTAAGLAGLAGRAYNTSQVDSIRQQQGLPNLSLGQWAGSLLGGNNYGSMNGNTTIANPEQFQNRLDGLYGPAKSLGYSPLNPSYAETLSGNPYNSFSIGPFNLGTSTPAWSLQNTNALLKGVKDPNYWGILDPNMEGSIPNAAGQAGGGGKTVASPSTATPRVSTRDMSFDRGGNGYGGSTSNGGGGGDRQGNDRSPGGGGLGNTSGGMDSHGKNEGGGAFRRGGFVPGRPDGIPDNVPARVDQGEFVVKQSAAKAAGRGLLRSLNTPAGARRMRGLLRSAA